MLGIIGAMEVEIEHLVAAMEHPVKTTVSRVDIWSGSLSGTDVMVCRSGIGKVSAAVAAQLLIARGADAIINTGVGGGLAEGLRQLDLVVSSALVQHDVDTSALGDPIGYISGLNIIVLPVDPKLCDILCLAAGEHRWPVSRGIIATGDQFVADSARSAFIAYSFSASVCDMEGGAIAQVCYMADVPFAAVRCISDNADGSAGMDYSGFAAVAAERCAGLVADFAGRYGR